MTLFFSGVLLGFLIRHVAGLWVDGIKIRVVDYGKIKTRSFRSFCVVKRESTDYPFNGNPMRYKIYFGWFMVEIWVGK